MKLFLKTKDFSVSGEEFDLLHDAEQDMLITHPQPKELESYYNSDVYISHTDSKASFTDSLYQRVKQYSLKKKIQLIDNQNLNNKSLLDYGAGTGDFLNVARDKGFIIRGIEPNKKARGKAQRKGVQLNEKIKELGKLKFDVITLWHVLEHLPNLDDQVKQITDLLKPNGVLIIAVPNYKSFDAKHYGKFWAAYDVPRHLWHFSKKSISSLFNKHQMEVVSTKPMFFDSFYVSLLSEKYKKSKLYLINAFFVGAWSNLMAFFSKEYSSHIYILKKKK